MKMAKKAPKLINGISTFALKHGLCARDAHQLVCRTIRAKSPFAELRCSNLQELRESTVNELHIDRPALSFRLAHGRTTWILYATRVIVNGRITKVLRVTTVTRQQETPWPQSATDPIRYLDERSA